MPTPLLGPIPFRQLFKICFRLVDLEFRPHDQVVGHLVGAPVGEFRLGLNAFRALEHRFIFENVFVEVILKIVPTWLVPPVEVVP